MWRGSIYGFRPAFGTYGRSHIRFFALKKKCFQKCWNSKSHIVHLCSGKSLVPRLGSLAIFFSTSRMDTGSVKQCPHQDDQCSTQRQKANPIVHEPNWEHKNDLISKPKYRRRSRSSAETCPRNAPEHMKHTLLSTFASLVFHQFETKYCHDQVQNKPKNSTYASVNHTIIDTFSSARPNLLDQTSLVEQVWSSM